MKIIASTIQMHRTSKKLVRQNISRWKETLSQKLGFSENPTALTLLRKVPPCTIILVQDIFFNLTIWKPTAQTFQNTLTFERYLFNSMSNFHANLVNWNSLHPINAILPTFLGQTLHFLCENEKKQNWQPTPSESFVRCGHFEPKGGGPTYTKNGAIICTTRWQ